MSNIHIQQDNKVHALFKMQVRDEDGNITKETDWFNNLVLDQGLNLMGGQYSWFNSCLIGTGNSAPNINQTSLDSAIAASATTVTNLNGASPTAPYYKWQRKTFRFSAGTATGNLSEVAIGTNYYQGGGSVMAAWNRALIKDSNGNPTTVTVLPTETLDVVCEVRLHIDSSDKTGIIDLGGGVVRNYTLRPMSINSAVGGFGGRIGDPMQLIGASCYAGGIGPITSTPSGRLNESQNTQETYATMSFKRKATAKWEQGNSTGAIGSLSVEWTNYCFYQIGFDSPITKSGTHELSITTEISWDRYEPT